MTNESILTKRGARHAGEIGFFPDNPVAEEDVRLATNGEEVICRWYSTRNLQALKFLWALVHMASDNSDRWLNKNEAMEELKLRVGFSRMVYNSETRELELRPKSLTRINNENLRLVTEQIMDVICNEILPGMKRNDLRKQIEKMVERR